MCEYVDCICTGINNVAVSSQTCKPSRLRHLREKGCPLSRKQLILAVASSDCTNKDILQTGRQGGEDLRYSVLKQRACYALVAVRAWHDHVETGVRKRLLAAHPYDDVMFIPHLLQNKLQLLLSLAKLHPSTSTRLCFKEQQLGQMMGRAHYKNRFALDL